MSDNAFQNKIAQSGSLLSVAELNVSLGGTTILSDISFGLSAGEFVAIVGPNGAGKTTLLRTLLGAAPFSSGCINLLGKSVDTYSTIERAKFLSYVPQSREVPAGFSVREFVEMGFYAQGYRFSSSGSIAESTQSILSNADLIELSERYLETLSGGELQRVYLAAALAQSSQIMLLDEPTTFLDPAHQRKLVSILTNARRENSKLSALIVTHDLNLAVSFAERILTLKDGTLVFDGAPEEFCDEKLLQEIYQSPMRFLVDSQTGKKVIVPALLDTDLLDTEGKKKSEGQSR